MKTTTKLVFVLLLCPILSHAKHLHTERWYQERSCTGELEYKLHDKKRVDCLTDEFAIEHDFAANGPNVPGNLCTMQVKLEGAQGVN